MNNIIVSEVKMLTAGAFFSNILIVSVQLKLLAFYPSSTGSINEAPQICEYTITRVQHSYTGVVQLHWYGKITRVQHSYTSVAQLHVYGTITRT
jgi:hypothetical protein